ncbi:hypothetical protein D2A34_13680 [Clostridium chromiireducens]|uniref:CYTH domain-containing protein n=1 Tax=Clostridium chromiireducens TaxID=225345 RepID=A0A399ITP7_9CLOT|nr:hypothetical protein [Clostridium chromiireducens]RII34206.1 hypothetical protein D2A34_13680 [Clostridium chromiireducens]
MKRKFKICSMMTLMLTLLNCSLAYGKTVTPAVPNYEVKIYMNPSVVLDSDNKLKQEVLDTFNMPSTVTKMSVEYLDSSNLDFNDIGWDVRLRKMEGDADFELTYKKRYSIANGNIDSALQTAALDGFDKSEDDYDAQVDWGYNKQTLSFSNDKDVSISGYSGMDLPSSKDSIKAAVKKIPGKLNNSISNNYGTTILQNSHIYGPVDAKRSIGTWNGEKFYIEVWKIKATSGSGYDYVVEASFKTDDRSSAQEGHDQLIELFNEKGWLLPEDQLKTQMILDRY